MTERVPTGLLSDERSHTLLHGVQCADDLLVTSLTRRPEDEDGSLALAAVETLTKRELQRQLRARAGDHDQLRWWLEGFVVGYCTYAVRQIEQAALVLGTDPAAQLSDMESWVLPRLGPDQHDASSVVFDLCRAILDADQIGLLWSLENLWIHDRPATVPEMFGRVRAVLVGAVNTACAARRLAELAHLA